MTLSLSDLFDLQDQAKGANLTSDKHVQELIGITDSAVRLAIANLSGTPFRAAKQTTFRVLGCEVVSASVVSARISLWGSLPEALATLRPAFEAGALLHWVANSNQYAAFAHELSAGRFRRFTYKHALKGLGNSIGDLALIHGDFSNFGSHLTASRLRTQAYEVGGESFDRVAFALDRDAVLASLLYTPAPLLQTLYALFLGYHQEGSIPSDEADLPQLMEHYLEVRRNCKASGQKDPA
jgi:hypothetical protein